LKSKIEIEFFRDNPCGCPFIKKQREMSQEFFPPQTTVVVHNNQHIITGDPDCFGLRPRNDGVMKRNNRILRVVVHSQKDACIVVRNNATINTSLRAQRSNPEIILLIINPEMKLNIIKNK
jgi:hypothetical protein